MAKVKFVTPKGRAKYPYLNTADFEFDAEGKFKVQLLVDKVDAKAIAASIDKVGEENFGPKDKWPQSLRLPIKTNEDDETQYVLAMTSKFKPRIHNWNGRLHTETDEPTLWGGSLLKAGGEISTYSGSSKGISLYFNRIQVLEAVGPGSGGDSSEGFESEDEYKPDGFDREMTTGAPDGDQATAQSSDF